MNKMYDTKSNKILLIDTYGDTIDTLLPDDKKIMKESLQNEYYFREVDNVKLYRLKDNENFWLTKILPTETMMKISNLITQFDAIIIIGSPLFDRA